MHSAALHFNYPTHRGIYGEHYQQIMLTASGAEYYNETLGTSCLHQGQLMGMVFSAGSSLKVFTASGYELGEAPNKIAAADGLVRLVAQQLSRD